jgi:four helix bundle protein
MNSIKSYQDLIIWRKSMELARKIYLATQLFPKSEVFGITMQMRRAAVSISSNIAEGQGRNTKGEFVQFLGIAKGSLYELESQIILSEELNLFQKTGINDLLADCAEISRLLSGLRKSLV